MSLSEVGGIIKSKVRKEISVFELLFLINHPILHD